MQRRKVAKLRTNDLCGNNHKSTSGTLLQHLNINIIKILVSFIINNK